MAARSLGEIEDRPLSEMARARRRPPTDHIVVAFPGPHTWSCDGRSFSDLYRLHFEAVFEVATRVGLPHLAGDVTQEAFVKLWRDPTRFDPSRGSLRTFLVMTTRGLAIDRARSDTARSAREARWGHTPMSTEPEEIAAYVLAEDTAAEVTEALGRLDTPCRDAIVAAFFGGLTYCEVAVALGLAEGTVKSRIRRGLSQLRDELGEL